MTILAPPVPTDATVAERPPSRAFAAKVATRLREDWPLLVAVLISVFITLGHAPYRDEWQALMIARDAGSPAELLDNLRYEGHPWLWYLPLWVATRFSRDIIAAQILCLAIAAASQYVIWRHAPFSREARFLLITGYFFVYEYAVFARAYGLGVLLLLLAALAVSRDRPAHAGVALGLACLTSAFGAVVAIAVAVGAYGGRLRSLSRPRVVALGTTFAGAAVAYLMTQPPADALHTGWRTALDGSWVRNTLSAPWNGTVPVRLPSSPWNANAVAQPWSVLLGIGVIAVGALVFGQSSRARRTWLVGSLLLMALVYGKGFALNRHTGHWFVLAVICAWIACAERPPSMLLRRVSAVVLAAGLVASVQAVLTERIAPISAAPAAAEWIEANLPDDAVLIGETDWSTSAVAGALDRPFWYPRTGELGTFIRWYDGYRDLTQDEIEARALAYAATTDRPVYLVLAYRELEPSPALELLSTFADSHVPEERYWVYRLVE